MVIERPRARQRVARSFGVHGAVALLGPRQCGKSTLARMIAEDEPEAVFFDLERAVDQRRLATPERALAPLEGLVVKRCRSKARFSTCCWNCSAYLGKIVETGSGEAIYRAPQHPYTQSLIRAIPVPMPKARRRQRQVLAGDVPSPIDPPTGCAFHPRCQLATERAGESRRRCAGRLAASRSSSVQPHGTVKAAPATRQVSIYSPLA